MRSASQRRTITSWVFLLLYLTISLVPILWLMNTSVKVEAQSNAYPPVIFPRPLTFQAYGEVLTAFSFLQNMRNSLVIAFGATLAAGVLGTLAAYGFSRFRFPANRLLMVVALGARMVAPIAMVLPFLILARQFKLFNSLWVLILANVYMNLPFVIWLMRGFIDGISTELDDAAMVDGCTRLQAMVRVILPLTVPGLAATLIMVFLFSWNEFLFGWALTNSLAAEPLTVGLKDFVGEQMVFWSLLSAAGVLTMLPALVFAVLFQRFIVSGLSAGAVKG